MGRRVVITGMGVVTSLGKDVETFWSQLVAGKSGISRIESFEVSDYQSQIGAEIKDFNPENYIEKKETKKMDRYVQLAIAASQEALRNANLDVRSLPDPERAGVYIGSGIGGLGTFEDQYKILLERGPRRVSPFFIPMMIANMASGWVSILTGAKGPNSTSVTACASGTNSIGDAFHIIQRDEADIMITGGAESTIRPSGYAGFCNMRAMSTRNDEPERASRPFDVDRDGFVMGEGAGVIVLEEYEHAKARGANIICEVIGYGMSGDAHHLTDPAPDGEGAARCMKYALRSAGIDGSAVDYVNAHGTSTPVGDKNESKAIQTVFGDHASKLLVGSTKSMTGHLLGAAGGVEAIISALTITKGIIPPTINIDNQDPVCVLDYVANVAREKKVDVAMSNSFGFGGHNATIIMKRV